MSAAFRDQQNTAENIERLRAASHFYGTAKVLLAWQIAGSVVGPVLLAVMIAAVPCLKAWGVIYSVIVSVADVLWLDPWQSRLRKLGARAQEEFDTGVLGVPWRGVQVGRPLGPEDVIAAAKSFGDSDTSVRDWYPTSVDAVGAPFRALICQRINVWWDGELRKRVATWVIVVLVIACLAIVAIGVGTHQPTDVLVQSVLAPVLPVLLWCIREARRQLDAANKLDEIKAAITSTWTEALQSRGSSEAIRGKVSDIQAAIFDHRSRHPLVFNWVHRRFRPKGQETMANMAERLVKEVERAVPGCGLNPSIDDHATGGPSR